MTISIASDERNIIVLLHLLRCLEQLERHGKTWAVLTLTLTVRPFIYINYFVFCFLFFFAYVLCFNFLLLLSLFFHPALQCFSSDGRWLLTSCLDSTVRVFDLASSRLIDWMRFRKPVTSLAFSLEGEFLATTHTDTLAVCLWFVCAHACLHPSLRVD